MKREERGSLIIEATYVFPIMFFVLLLLIYMGNMFYMRSQVDSIVAETAVKAAAYCADPMIASMGESVPTDPSSIDIKPYHSIWGKAEGENLRDEMHTRLKKLGTGFFAGMGLKTINIVQFEKNTSLISSTFIVEVEYRIKFPIRFLGSDEPTVLTMDSMCEVPITDTPEFILNVDMAMDYYDASSLPDLVEKIKNALPFFK